MLAEDATILAVMVVPIFSPNTSMIPWSMCKMPVEHKIIVMAMIAADDCTQSVSTVPMMRKKKEFQKLGSLKLAKKALMDSAVSGTLTKLNPVSFNVPNPKNKKAAPKRKSPMMRLLFMYMSMIPRKKAG